MTRAALLDVDGTLVDSNDAHARAYVEAFAAFGRGDITFDDVRPLIGMGGDLLVPKLLGNDTRGSVQRDLQENIDAEKGRVFRAHYLPKLHAIDGARDLVKALHALHWRVVVASSGAAEDVERILAQAGLAELLPDRTSADDADRSKPCPDIIRAALRKAGVEAKDALLVGDTPYDVAAGTAAGVRTVALRTGGWDDAALRGALMIYDDARQLAEDFQALAEPAPFLRAVGDSWTL